MNIFRTIFNVLVVTLILAMLRSSLAMFLVGIILGVSSYHLYPSKVQSVIHSITGTIDEGMDKVYSTPVKNLLPEERSNYESTNQYSRETY
ncbi:hypothetical protein JCM30760_26200 [Thiomicrorhabdus hydrogeniphila]